MNRKQIREITIWILMENRRLRLEMDFPFKGANKLRLEYGQEEECITMNIIIGDVSSL